MSCLALSIQARVRLAWQSSMIGWFADKLLVPLLADHISKSLPVPEQEQFFGELKLLRIRPILRGTGLDFPLICPEYNQIQIS